MLTRKQASIVRHWRMHNDLDPDISTERLMAMVADDTKRSIDDIAAALLAADMQGEA